MSAQLIVDRWRENKHRENLFDVCHDPEEAYKRICALEEIARVLSERVDELEAEQKEINPIA
jgi:hypothetical protein